MHSSNRREAAMRQLSQLVLDENGPTAIEYGLIAALIAVAIIAALILLGGALGNIFGYMGNTVNNYGD
jgi:pilus assembly protein Flp/PilA